MEKLNEGKKFLEIYRTEEFQLFIDVCRVLLFIVAVLILWTLIKNIEAVKILSYDVCAICQSKANCSCFCYNIP